MSILIQLAAFIIIYLIAVLLSKYTTLGQYRWFQQLTMKVIMMKYGRKKNISTAIINSKVFHCNTCHVFWISLMLFAAVATLIFMSFTPFVVLNALVVYIINKSNKQ